MQEPKYGLGTKVRYTSYFQAYEEPWRVVGRTVTEMLEMLGRVSYVIQPWALTGQWTAHDRPLMVLEEQLTLWEET